MLREWSLRLQLPLINDPHSIRLRCTTNFCSCADFKMRRFQLSMRSLTADNATTAGTGHFIVTSKESALRSHDGNACERNDWSHSSSHYGQP